MPFVYLYVPEESDGVTTKNVSQRDFYFVAVLWE